ncbi:MAG: tetrahydrofolate dehydrogenase/cyclohydrolase catalytic domain-containing protein, partial [Comamonas sp.]
MTAQIIDGKVLSEQLRKEVATRAAALKTRGITPGLAVVLVGDNQASQVYVRNKVKACEDVGFHSVLEKYDASMTEAELLARVEALNNDPSIHGILVQLPLPKHIDDHKVIETISPAKDVDGFHVASAGALMVGEVGFKACTPYGCMKMLLAANATVTVTHSGTADLAAMTRQADVIVAAVGKVDVLTADMVKPGAVVIDVGMNRNAEGKLCGDVDFAGVKEVAGYITPVPGGVGPMTIT